jgi:tetratricopeptide (TPR) repeat protein
MGAFRAAVFVVLIGSAGQSGPDPWALLKEADRLAWLRAWSAAEPHFLQAQKLFAARGDERNALYAEVSAFRGALPRMAVAEASSRLADYLEHPLVQADERLRLRVLIIKGETDQDLDPTLAEQSWREAQTLAESLGDAAWTNRARGELGLVAFLQGDVGGAVVGLGQGLTVAQSNGDVSSVVRWLTLFGHRYVQLGRPEEALAFYDRALAAAAAVPEIQFPVMTHVGRSNALIRLGRLDEADGVLAKAGEVAARSDALAILREDRRHPDRLIHLQPHKPPEQDVVVELLHEQSLAADGVEDLEQLRAQQPLRRNGRPTDGRVQPVELPRHLRQHAVHQRADRAQRMVLRHPLLRRHVTEHRIRLAIVSTHAPIVVRFRWVFQQAPSSTHRLESRLRPPMVRARSASEASGGPPIRPRSDRWSACRVTDGPTIGSLGGNS